MGLLIQCPEATEINDISVTECPESIGQIQKVIFQREFASAGTKNFFVIGTANPNLLASWTTLLAASDSTKVVQSPFISAPTTEPGAPRTYGGGNETLGGVEIIIGREPTSFSANFLETSQKTIEQVKTLQTESMAVYLVDEYGRIIGLVDDHASPVNFYPIPIKALFIGDKNFGGLDEADLNQIMWKFLPNWSDKLHIVTPSDFDALNDLVSA